MRRAAASRAALERRRRVGSLRLHRNADPYSQFDISLAQTHVFPFASRCETGSRCIKIWVSMSGRRGSWSQAARFLRCPAEGGPFFCMNGWGVWCEDDMSDGRPSTSTTLSGSSLDDYIVGKQIGQGAYATAAWGHLRSSNMVLRWPSDYTRSPARRWPSRSTTLGVAHGLAV